MEKLNTLISEEDIQKRIKELAKVITKDYEGKELTLICILKGSTFFTVDLAKRIDNKLKLEFIEVSSYENGTQSSGKITLNKDIKGSVEGKDILVVEDIIDTGRTLSYLLDHLKKQNPASIKLCTLLNKPSRRIIDVKVDYIGFDIEDKFVVGYGLDVDQCYRNLPYIAYIQEN